MKQTSVAVLRIREMILQGVLPAGERVREADLAERLGLSRTPIRQALPALAQERLLVPSGKRGYSVKAFTVKESLEALELRAVLEGLAARALAQQGVSAYLSDELRACLRRGDAIFVRHKLLKKDELEYAEMNDKFHRLIVQGAGRPQLMDLVEQCNFIPFVAPVHIAFDQMAGADMFRFLSFAHQQHHFIVDAIVSGDGARAESLLREHAQTQKRSLTLGQESRLRGLDGSKQMFI
jgi:GntR family transcriptional regulator of vanillate catabolism